MFSFTVTNLMFYCYVYSDSLTLRLLKLFEKLWRLIITITTNNQLLLLLFIMHR